MAWPFLPGSIVLGGRQVLMRVQCKELGILQRSM